MLVDRQSHSAPGTSAKGRKKFRTGNQTVLQPFPCRRVERQWGGIDMKSVGRKSEAIATGYLASESSSSDRALVSQETARTFNAGDRDRSLAVAGYLPVCVLSAKGALQNGENPPDWHAS